MPPEDNMKSLWSAVLLLGSGLNAVPAVAAEDAAQDPVVESFAELKNLVGIWRQVDKPQSPLRIRFSLTAGGSVVVEEWLRGDQPHSMTVYHRDGPNLLATHYCPQGNQPRLVASMPVSAKRLQWTLQDATDLDSLHESHLIALGFDLSIPGQIARTETYRQGDADEHSALQLVRDVPTGVDPG